MKSKSKTSNIENQASLWLVTCSDLFFLLFGFFVLNHTLPHEVQKGTFEVVDSIPALRNHLQQDFASDYATVKNGHDIASNLVAYSVSQKWFTPSNSLSLFGDTQFRAILDVVSNSETKVELEIEIPEVIKNENDFELALKLKSLIEENSEQKLSVRFKEVVNVDNSAKFNLLVRF